MRGCSASAASGTPSCSTCSSPCAARCWRRTSIRARSPDTLTAGLSPVDEDLVEQAARDFENLAAVQKQYDDLAAADTAVQAFLAQYVAYLRAHTRHQLDQVTARITAAAVNFGAITVAAREVARSGQEERRAIDEGKLAKTRVDTFDARLFALKNRDAYKDHEKLAIRRSQLEKEQKDLAAQQVRLTQGLANVRDLEQEAGAMVGRLAEVGRAVDRHARNLVETADRAGVSRDGEPADSGEDLHVTSKARAATRRDDIRKIRAQIGLVRDAERDSESAETALGTAQQLLGKRSSRAMTPMNDWSVPAPPSPRICAPGRAGGAVTVHMR